ncbi:MAG: hypothetical protein ACLQVM_29390 [Terriglobia bacterium]
MSLRKTTQLTLELPAATRQDAGHSTGPRSAAAKIRLRKEPTNLPTAPGGQDDGARMENIEEALGGDIMSDDSQSVEAVEDLKVKGMTRECL